MRAVLEAVVLAVVVLSPWAFGGVDPIFELLMASGVALVLMLWVAIVFVGGRLNWVRCPAALCLAGLTLLGLFQLVPMPGPVEGVLSPGGASLRAELVPDGPEIVAPGDSPAPRPGLRPLSVYPYVTRVEVVRWLGVFVLFTAVRNQLATTGSMRRLCAVMLINGTVLSLFGLAQFFSSRHSTVYGYETAGQVFGPFIYRNHFASYLNLCLALGVGLLLTTGPDESDRRRRLVQKPNALEEQEEVEPFFSPFSVLHSPMQLWICVALAAMLAGLMCSLSRGGVATLGVGLVVVLVLRLTTQAKVRRLELLVLPAVFLIGLLAWTGVRPLESRLSTLWKGDAFQQDNRRDIWLNLLGAAAHFPVAGSGYGTLQYVEPPFRTRPLRTDPNSVLIVDHAHNDYIEGLVEGGLPRLLLMLGLLVAVCRLGYKALGRFAGRTPSALAFGALLGVVTLALHACVDFVISTPAVAALAAVLGAQLASLSRNDPTVLPSSAHSGVLSLRLNAPAKVVVGAGFLAVAAVLVLQTWQSERVHAVRLAAFRAVRGDAPEHERAAQFLAAGTQLAPDNAELRVELAQLYLDARQRVVRRQEIRGQLELLAGAAAASDPTVALGTLGAWPAAGRLPEEMAQALNERYLQPGLRAMIAARDLCPLLPRPHMRLAGFARQMVQADPPAAYWTRARRLSPDDAELFYFSGLQALRDQRPDEAWAFWKTSLTLSDKFLAPMLATAADRLTPQELLTRVLPDHPEYLLYTATWIEKEPPARTTRPLLERAAALFDAKPDMTWLDYHTKFHVLSRLDRVEEAIKAYRTAIELNSSHGDMRIEFARYLEASGNYDEAYKQLVAARRLRHSQPADFEELFKRVERQRALP